MSTLKCKMCGGTLEVENGAKVVTCEYCSTKQTLPRLDDDRKTNLYDRANHFRRNNEYDKAMSIYEQILNEDNTDAESYWSIVLCRYGIEYVEDPATHKRVPTVNRAQFTSVLADEDYKKALEYADIEQKIIYEAEAHAIDEIQKGILEISNKEEPFDVFICYKETDNNGRRTQDSVLATDLYHQLIQEGFKVFFSRITLEDKLGTAYEPYIFAALNSAKVMVVLGTKPEYFNAVWVKNEWSRYLALVKNGNGKKILIPAYRDMDPYDLPEEFSHLQAQDMSKLGFMQDLIRGIKKIAKADEPKSVVKETVLVGGNANTAPLLKRAFICIEDGEWDRADDFCEQVLNQDPENAQAYLGKLMAELHVRKQDDLQDYEAPFDDNKNYRNIVRFGDESLSSSLKGYIDQIKERNEHNRLTDIYDNAVSLMKAANTEEEYKAASSAFKSIPGFMDSDELEQICLDKAEESRKDVGYEFALEQMKDNQIASYENAIKAFQVISGWKDSERQIEVCQKAIDSIRAKEEERRLERERKTKRLKKTVAIVTPIVIICIVLVGVFVNVILPKMKYNKAMSLLDSGDYSTAYTLLAELGYNDVITANKNERAQNLLASGDYEAAYALFMELGNEEAIVSSKNDRAMALLAEEDYDAAYVLLEELGNNEAIYSSMTDRAMVLASSGDYETGRSMLEEIGNTEAIPECTYDYGLYLVDTGDYVGAYNVLRGLNYSDSNELLESIMPQVYDAPLTDVEVGSYVFFGSYEQDNDLSNGPEPIEWRILDVEDGRMLLLSRYALDCQPFNENGNTNYWENSSLRNWLNDDFYTTAFSSDEQSIIQTTSIITVFVETQDRVFIMSHSEASDYNLSYACQATDYCVAQGASTTLNEAGNCLCLWWDRNRGSSLNDQAYYFNNYGTFGYGLIDVDSDYIAVRPAIWVSIES